LATQSGFTPASNGPPDDAIVAEYAGDATYDQDLLRQRIVDGQARDVAVSISTLDRIAAFAAAEPTVLLPAHDPAAEQRLAEQILLTA
jgi:glyoxylase-like metal-dependent hydrolase (beta-lactamase superfamily II)